MQLRLLVVLFVATTELCEAQNKLHYRTLKRRARRALKLSAGGRCQSDMDCISGSQCSSCTSAQCEPCTSSPGRRLFGAPAGTMCECVASPPPDPRPPAPPPPPPALFATTAWLLYISATWVALVHSSGFLSSLYYIDAHTHAHRRNSTSGRE